MIRSLTSMRFFAALLVFVYHYQWLNADYNNWPLGQFWSNLVSHGFLGVSFFFVLSGFVLSKAYQQKFRDEEISLANFYVARFARIYPLHLVTLLAAIPLMSNSPWSDAIYTAVPFNLTLTQSFAPDESIYFSFNSPSWSISNEMFFYALFPALVLFRTRSLFCSMFLLSGMIVLTWTMLQMSVVLNEHHEWFFYINPIYRLLEFISGIAVFRLGEEYSQATARIGTNFGTCMEAIVLLSLFSSVYFVHMVPTFLAQGAFFAPFFSLVILCFSLEAGLLSRAMVIKPLVYLGEISFSIYLVHQLVFRYLSDTSIVDLVQQFRFWGLIGVLMLVLGLSALSHRYIELPLNAWIKHAFARSTSASHS